MSETETKDSPEQQQFRAEIREWLSSNVPERPAVRLPQTPIEILNDEQLDYLVNWQRQAYEAGLVGCDYPPEFGGGGRDKCQVIANEEMQRIGAPFFANVIGLGLAAPTIYFHGSEALKKRFLPKIFSAGEIWCQGFSEPGAGSDLASVQTFAERKGDKWIINGHKVWTSMAQYASWMILLARTDKTQKHAGLSYFLVPIKEQLGRSVTVRPLVKMTGETGFNEVLFENLEVSDEYRLDEVGKGWQVAMTTLQHERNAGPLVTPQGGGQQSSLGSNIGAEGLVSLAKENYRNGKLAADDAVIRDQIIQMLIRQEGFLQNARRARVAALNDHPERIALQFKVLKSEIRQDSAALAMEIEGAASSLYVGDEHAPRAGYYPMAYMNSYGFTIAAGSNEVQRNILGDRVLGLAKTK